MVDKKTHLIVAQFLGSLIGLLWSRQSHVQTYTLYHQLDTSKLTVQQVQMLHAAGG